ncbi:hypothetical protein ACWEWX_49690, partial [Streptomyces asiaticus]
MADQLELSAAPSGYVREFSLREDTVLAELREQTSQLPAGSAMQVRTNRASGTSRTRHESSTAVA